MTIPQFPPLLNGFSVPENSDPSTVAVTMAKSGCDSGSVVYSKDADALRAAIVFAPEVPLSKAIAMLPVCGLGLQNALGALSPPELPVYLQWDGGIRVNGAKCGALSVWASSTAPDLVPGWLVVGLNIPFIPQHQDGGHTPNETALYAEGCSEITTVSLLESWTKHTLVWTNRWENDGLRAVHAEWVSIAHGIDQPETIQGGTGIFVGVDEDFGMLLRSQNSTHLFPLTTLLETK